jgi:putative transposase
MVAIETASPHAGAGPNPLGPVAGSLPRAINAQSEPPYTEASAGRPANLPQPLLIKEGSQRQSEKCQRVANLRYALIQAFKADAEKNHRPKTEIVRDFLATYNAGVSHPEIYGELGALGRSTLYMWLKAEETGGIDGLVPDYSRAGISKVTDHEKNVLLALLLHQNRLKIAYAIKLAKTFLAQKKIASPSSESTLRRYSEDFKREHYDLWTLRREGEKALCDKVLPYIQRDRTLLEVGEGLVADGHRLNFQVVNPFTGKPCRAAMVLFWDWRSGYPLGWEIMLEENVQCIATALRNAILCLGKTPKWVLLDNGKAFKSRIFTSVDELSETEIAGIFARLDINCHFAMPYNAQAKPIERFFRTFNDWFERMVSSYTGASIEDKPAWMRRNEKIAQKAHDPWVPEIPEVNEMMVAWREFYAEQPSKGLGGQRPREIFEPGRGPGVDPGDLVHMMMPREIKTTHRNGVTFLGRNWYDDNLYGYKDSVLIKYSLSDLSEIYVYSMKGEFLCAARPVEDVAPMASETGNPQDMEAVKRAIARKKTVKRRTLELHKMLGSKQADQMLPWKEITAEVPKMAEAIEKIENEKKDRKVVSISPFIDEPQSAPSYAKASDGRERASNGRPASFDNDYEKYDWLQAHPEEVTERDRAWTEDFLSRSSLYKHAASGLR